MPKIYFFLLSVVLYCAVIRVNGANHLRIYLSKVDYVADHDYFKVSVKFQNNSEHHILLDVDVEAIQNIDDTVSIEIEAHMKQPDGEYIRVLKTPIRNLCELFSKPELEPLFLIAFDGLKHHGNIVDSCPYKKGHYSVKNYKIDPAKLPDVAIPGEFRTDMEIFITEAGKRKQILKFMWYTMVESIH